mmetsp:Transcript_33311/g.106348  ORF Transcript_33311/g.106348 Transcript_33311/m.106348 type:complete len:211 (+) Transcript_33311:121-753(+)
MVASSLDSSAPEKRETSLPPLKKTKVGMEETAYFCAMGLALSTSTARKAARLACLSEMAANLGFICWQGPHQVAQKSTQVSFWEAILRAKSASVPTDWTVPPSILWRSATVTFFARRGAPFDNIAFALGAAAGATGGGASTPPKDGSKNDPRNARRASSHRRTSDRFPGSTTASPPPRSTTRARRRDGARPEARDTHITNTTATLAKVLD